MSDDVHFPAFRAPDGTAGRGSDGAARRFAVSAARLLQDWKAAHARAVAYLEALGVPEDERESLAAHAVERAVEGTGDAVAATLDALRQLVCESGDAGAGAFRAWRLNRALAGLAPGTDAAPGLSPIPLRDGTLCAAPPLARRSMVSEPMDPRFFRGFFSRRRAPSAAPADHALYGRPLRLLRRRLPWTHAAHRRRLLLMALVLIPTTVASGFMVNVLPNHGTTWLELAIVAFFGALFGWISIGFWTALLGFLTLVRRRDRFAITSLGRSPGQPAAALDPGLRTAIVMPICAEPVDRVFAGLRAIHRSLERAGALHLFHFFVLSDTAEAGAAVKEEEAWFEWCRAVDGFDRIFYRRRKVRLERKSGNVAAFCRRWGMRYRYMIMLDADSVMAGETLVRLVELMERHADVGMIQTAPTAVSRRSLFARVQQFASRIYGPMFAAGLHFWQLGDGQYWGHNTIIRVQPFMDHCALDRKSV